MYAQKEKKYHGDNEKYLRDSLNVLISWSGPAMQEVILSS